MTTEAAGSIHWVYLHKRQQALCTLLPWRPSLDEQHHNAQVQYLPAVCLCVLQVWSDEHKKALGDRRFLVLWRPIAPAGYVAMGLIVAVGGTAPSLAQASTCT